MIDSWTCRRKPESSVLAYHGDRPDRGYVQYRSVLSSLLFSLLLILRYSDRQLYDVRGVHNLYGRIRNRGSTGHRAAREKKDPNTRESSVFAKTYRDIYAIYCASPSRLNKTLGLRGSSASLPLCPTYPSSFCIPHRT